MVCVSDPPHKKRLLSQNEVECYISDISNREGKDMPRVIFQMEGEDEERSKERHIDGGQEEQRVTWRYFESIIINNEAFQKQLSL